jgi:hypothetical protein
LPTTWLAVGKAERFGIEEAGDCHFKDTFDRIFDFRGPGDSTLPLIASNRALTQARQHLREESDRLRQYLDQLK